MPISSIDLTEPLKRALGLRGDWAPELVPMIQPIISLGDLAAGAVAPLGIPWGFWIESNAPGAGLHAYCVIQALEGMAIRVDRFKCFVSGAVIMMGKRTENLPGGAAIHFVTIRDAARYTDDTSSTSADASVNLVAARVGSEALADLNTAADPIGELAVGGVWGQGDDPLAWLVPKKNGTPFVGGRTRSANVAERWALQGYAFPLP